MLTLERKAFESFVIGDNIEVTVYEIRGDQVFLSVSAPRSVKVLRKELVVDDREALLADWRIQRLRQAISRNEGQIGNLKGQGLPTDYLEQRVADLKTTLRLMEKPIQASNDDLSDLGKRTEVVDV